MSKVPTWCVPVIYVCFPLASCVSHVPSPNNLDTYPVTREAWSQMETTEQEYGDRSKQKTISRKLVLLPFLGRNIISRAHKHQPLSSPRLLDHYNEHSYLRFHHGVSLLANFCCISVHSILYCCWRACPPDRVGERERGNSRCRRYRLEKQHLFEKVILILESCGGWQWPRRRRLGNRR
jgi:hypothetical protein